jgi:transcriptional regulator with GAF, ATPase, and Fis domain
LEIGARHGFTEHAFARNGRAVGRDYESDFAWRDDHDRNLFDLVAEAPDRKVKPRRFDSGRMNLRRELSELEKAALSEALRRSGGNLARAARLLGEVGRGASRDPAGTVRAMLNRLGLSANSEPNAES